ncbi:hypothetical protein LOZ53_006247 [Ophidiomyces ophidiicola]|nr:hypothetical protein LOZ55_006633 [Ophidiomyces ophidiicola]KAI1979512.1 hypothetical protein LOZ54_006050 [Ophidiomyces ophidiicola]KAI1982601.1 hypothetical protein LOZ53_006247 [Ophidiomyces ophidiicola]KAI1986493.1 hypothetical protein LOZ51_006087 [Ophidiomyces ophidiicola]
MAIISKLGMGEPPKESLNWKLGVAVLCFGLLGASRGIDEGLIGGTVQQKSFIMRYGLSPSERADRLGNITSMVQIGSIGGALIAFYITDHIGRIWATWQLCLGWIAGIAIYECKWQARSVIGPTYLAEISPPAIRSLCTCAFSGAVYLAIVVAYFANWRSSLHSVTGRKMNGLFQTSIHIIFAGLILLLSLVIKESPRYLIKVGKDAMVAIRNLPAEHSYIQTEMREIYEQLKREQEVVIGTTWFSTLRELLLVPSNRYCIMLGLMPQVLSQWSGATSITIYAPEFFAMLGTTGQSEKLLVTAMFGIVKLVASLVCALFLVDSLGRKRALSYGITLQLLRMLYVAIYLAVIPSIRSRPKLSRASKSAGTAAIVSIYVSGVGWALGWNSVQYLIGAEIFPLRVRASAVSLIMCFHFVNQ